MLKTLKLNKKFCCIFASTCVFCTEFDLNKEWRTAALKNQCCSEAGSPSYWPRRITLRVAKTKFVTTCVVRDRPQAQRWAQLTVVIKRVPGLAAQKDDRFDDLPRIVDAVAS